MQEHKQEVTKNFSLFKMVDILPDAIYLSRFFNATRQLSPIEAAPLPGTSIPLKIYGPRQAKMCHRACAKCTFIPRMRKVQFGYLLSIDTVYSVQQICWQTAKVKASAQSYLGLRCPHMYPKTRFRTARPISS